MVFPTTWVRLLSNVPFSSSYTHIRDFATVNDQINYFVAKTKNTYSEFTYQRQEQAVKVPTNIDSLYDVNYLMFQNSDYSSKWFYAFVTRKEYINPNTTAVYFKLDVYQTWMFDFTVKESYVIREHADRWNADGSPVLNTLDEGLDYGDEYETIYCKQVMPYEDMLFLVIVCTEKMHGETNEITPMLNGSPQPLTYYIHPFKPNGETPSTFIDGGEEPIDGIMDVLKGLYTIVDAQNNVVSLYVTESTGVPLTVSAGSVFFSSADVEPAIIASVGQPSVTTFYVKNALSYVNVIQTIGDKYEGFTQPEESKLLMHPYTVTILTDMKGNFREIKNEYIRDPDLKIHIKGSMGVSNKISYHVSNYLMDSVSVINSGEIGMENGIINNNPNDVPIITDLLSAYLQGNRNQLENQTNQIAFNGMMSALGGLSSGNKASGIVEAGASGMNTYFSLEALNAKQKDLDATPAQLNRMGGNTAFDYGHDIKGLFIVKKQITDEYRDRLSSHFKMFGYKTNKLKVPNLTGRLHFNFVHTQDINLSGNIPDEQKEELKSIFNRGVTIWHGDYVGDYSKVNGETA